MDNCPGCGTGEFEPLMTVDSAPISCATLFRTKAEAAGSGSCRIEIVMCLRCSHIWNRAFQADSVTKYTGDYHSSVTQSPQARQYQKSLARELDDLVGLGGRTVMEIGCGDGFFLSELSSLGAMALGYEPSSTFDTADTISGIRVKNGYFDFDGAPGSEPSADVVIMRHVLEHLPHPIDVVRSFRSGLFQEPRPEFLFIEVPNSYQLLSEDLYFDFYNDHIQYFSTASLTSLISAAGWMPLAAMGTEREFIRMLFKNSDYGSEPPMGQGQAIDGTDAPDVMSVALAFKKDYLAWVRRLKEVIDGQSAQGNKVAVWGAGARGISLLSGLREAGAPISYIVDSDPVKHGKYVPLANLPVYSADHLKSDPVECVLVSSYTFFNEISSQLRWFSEQGGKIIKVYPNPEVV